MVRFLIQPLPNWLNRDVSEILSAAAEFSRYLNDPSDRLIAYIECSRIYGQLGYARKSAFFARQVAQQYQQQDSRWAAVSALQVSAPWGSLRIPVDFPIQMPVASAFEHLLD